MRMITITLILIASIACFVQYNNPVYAKQAQTKLIHFESKNLGTCKPVVNPKTGIREFCGDLPKIIENRFESAVVTVIVAVPGNCSQEFEGSIEVNDRFINLKYTQKPAPEEETIADCQAQHNLTYKIEGVSSENYILRLNGKFIRG